MKTKYIVGFFAAVLLVGVLLTAGYQISYERIAERNAAPGNEVTDTRSITAQGEAVDEESREKEEGYYLCEMQGFVVVLLNDRQTIYEMTEIPLTDLPEEIQQEIATGKYIATKDELYGFLENYSS